jgi:DNA-binding HxlR family transcriptional regulator
MTPGAATTHAVAVMSKFEKFCLGAADDRRAIRVILDRLGDTWTCLRWPLSTSDGCISPERQWHIPGISQRMLFLTLRHLERDGLVTRTMHAEDHPGSNTSSPRRA